MAVDCASTFCRAELHHESLSAGKDYIAQLTLDPPFATSGHVSNLDPTVSLLYFARAGAHLPR